MKQKVILFTNTTFKGKTVLVKDVIKIEENILYKALFFSHTPVTDWMSDTIESNRKWELNKGMKDSLIK